jgi:hypothetical protein
MNPTTQTFLAVLIVLGCLAYVAWQGMKIVRAKSGCASGCGNCGAGEGGRAKPQAASVEARPAPVQFVPVEFLTRRKK